MNPKGRSIHLFVFGERLTIQCLAVGFAFLIADCFSSDLFALPTLTQSQCWSRPSRSNQCPGEMCTGESVHSRSCYPSALNRSFSSFLVSGDSSALDSSTFFAIRDPTH